jgi:hypothetical protein
VWVNFSPAILGQLYPGGDNSDIFIQLVLFSGIILFYSLFSLFEHLSAALVGEKEGGTDGQ